MKHGQHAQQRVGRADLDPVKHRFHFAEKVGVGEHDTFRISGSSGGVEQGSDVIGRRGRRLEFSRTIIENRRQLPQPLLLRSVLCYAVRVHEHEPYVQIRNCFARGLRMLEITKQGGGTAVFQQLGQLVGMERCVERHDGASGGDNTQINCHPPRMVICHDGQPRSACEPVFVDPSSDGFCHAAEFGVSATLKLIVSLKFKRDIVRPSLLAFEKAVIEGGHGSWGIYTKNGQLCRFIREGPFDRTPRLPMLIHVLTRLTLHLNMLG